MSDEVQRDLGRHDAKIADLESKVVDMAEDVHAIKEMLAELRGGKKAVVILASAAATAGAAVSWFASFLHSKPDGLP